MATVYEQIIRHCEHDEDFIKRARTRWTYFENDNYRKLSKILSVYEYHDKKEVYTLYYYLKNKNEWTENINSALKVEIEKNRYNHEIDWKAIFDYFDKRKTEAKNTKYALYNEVERVLKILEPYREELIGQNNFVLY